MNRLCLGALGLLLALFATCYAEDIVLEDFKERGGESYKLNEDEQKGLSKLLGSDRSDQYQFLIEATGMLYNNTYEHKDFTEDNKAGKKQVMDALEGMNNLPDDYDKKASLKVRLEKLEKLGGNDLENLDNRKSLAYQCARLFHYLASMKVSLGLQFKGENYTLVQRYIKTYEHLAEKHKDNSTYVMPNPLEKDQLLQHSPDWSKEKWDQEYMSLPEIKKYFANGLNPATKMRLNKNFKKLESNEDYKMKKKMSEEHIDHIAIQARLEAIKHSHTAAGQYFSTHENWIHKKLAQINEEMEKQHKKMKEEE